MINRVTRKVPCITLTGQTIDEGSSRKILSSQEIEPAIDSLLDRRQLLGGSRIGGLYVVVEKDRDGKIRECNSLEGLRFGGYCCMVERERNGDEKTREDRKRHPPPRPPPPRLLLPP